MQVGLIYLVLKTANIIHDNILAVENNDHAQ
jgi:hypothetical protein